MTNTNHPITPPPELMRKWDTCNGEQDLHGFSASIATQAAQWGWDQRNATVEAELQQARDEELNSCCIELTENIITASSCYGNNPYFSCSWRELASIVVHKLRAARRPEQPSEAEQALEALDSASYQPGTDFKQIDPSRSVAIRRALERLQELERGEVGQ